MRALPPPAAAMQPVAELPRPFDGGKVGARAAAAPVPPAKGRDGRLLDHRRIRRFRPHHRPFPRRFPVGDGAGDPVRAAARRQPGGFSLPRPALADRHRQRPARPAAGGGRSGALPGPVPCRAARRTEDAVHAGRHGARPDCPGDPDRRGPGSSRGRRSVVGLWRRASNRRRDAAARHTDAARHGTQAFAHGGPCRLRPHHFRGRRHPGGRRQYRGLYPHHDDDDCAGDQQGQPVARPRAGTSS